AERMVAAGDVGAAVELPVRGGEVENRRGHGADVDDVDSRRARALDETHLEPGRRLAIVLTDGDGAPALSADQRAVGAADETEDLGIDVGADAPTDVIGAEDV